MKNICINVYKINKRLDKIKFLSSLFLFYNMCNKLDNDGIIITLGNNLNITCKYKKNIIYLQHI